MLRSVEAKGRAMGLWRGILVIPVRDKGGSCWRGDEKWSGIFRQM